VSVSGVLFSVGVCVRDLLIFLQVPTAAPSNNIEDLLFFFEAIRDTIQQRASNGRCGPSGPFTKEGRDTFRANKVQKTRHTHNPSSSARQQYGKPVPAWPASAASASAAAGQSSSAAAGADGGAGRMAGDASAKTES